MARHLMAAAVLLMAAGIAGAQADITGRIVADIFNHHLGQKFVVENAGGAGGSTHRATEIVIASAAIAVGTLIAERPPGRRRRSPAPGSHRTWRADFPHHALRQLVHSFHCYLFQVSFPWSADLLSE